MGITLTYHGHACFTIEAGGYRIVTDPYDGHVPGYAPLELTANAVYCSHGHMDHAYVDAVTVEDGPENPFTVREIESDHDPEGGSLRGKTFLRVFEAEGLRVVHMGDIGRMLNEQELALVAGADVMMIPVGGFYTVDAAGAEQILKAAQPKVVIPMHYRKGPRGFDVIGTLEDFLPLRHDVRMYEGSSITVDADTERQTAVLTSDF